MSDQFPDETVANNLLQLSEELNLASLLDNEKSLLLTSHCELLGREEEASSEPACDKSKGTKKNGERYLPHFKEKVTDFALSCSIKEASTHFKVNKSTVADWLRDKGKFRQKITVGEQKEKDENDPERNFLQWLKEMRESGSLITQEMLQKKLKAILNQSSGIKHRKTWLEFYAERLDSSSEKKRITYPLKFRKEVALLGQKLSKNSVSKTFKIARKRILQWSMEDSERTKRDCRKNVTNTEIDQRIWTWYQSETTKPSSLKVRQKASSMYHAAGFSNIRCSQGWFYRWQSRYSLPRKTSVQVDIDSRLVSWVLQKLDRNIPVTRVSLTEEAALMRGESFKTSCGWTVRFLKRQARFLRRVPSPHLELPLQLEEACCAFRKSIEGYINDKCIKIESIIVFDEIPLFNFGGKREHLLRETGFENCHASLILCCRGDGTLLPAALILKNSNLPSATQNVLPLNHEKGVCDSTTLKDWAEMVLLPSKPALVLCDAYEPHTEVKTWIEEKTSSCVMILPPGCNSRLNPLMYGLAERYKSEVETKWRSSFMNYTSDSVNLPGNTAVFTWVDEIHAYLAKAMQAPISVSFKDAGLVGSQRGAEVT